MKKILALVLSLILSAQLVYGADKAVVYDDTNRKVKVSDPLPIAQGGTGSATQNFVGLTGDQSVGGVKTFTSIPVLPASDPTSGNQASRKDYVDTKVIAPSSTTENKVPQWDNTQKKLKDGLTVGIGANNLVQLDGSAKLPAVDGSQLTGLSSVTQVNDVETDGVNYGNQTTIFSVNKTITSGKTVLLIASGYSLNNSGYPVVSTLTLKQDSTIVQTIIFGMPNTEYEVWSFCRILTGLSGEITFSVVGNNEPLQSLLAKGSLVVLEF